MTKEVAKNSESIFENIKHIEDGKEFWYARELAEALEYTWEGFEKIVAKAMVGLNKINMPVENQIRQVSIMVKRGYNYSNMGNKKDFKLTRFACYVIAQNGNPTKKVRIAEAQSYFATQTRKQELSEKYKADMARLARRQEFSESDKSLSSAIMEAGICPRGLAEIKNSGDMQYFNGKTTKEMKKKLGTGSEPWANKAHNVVLAGKTLANELTTANIERYGVTSFDDIKHDNDDNNMAVRTTIIEQQGMAPEEFPASEDTNEIQARIKANTNGLLN